MKKIGVLTSGGDSQGMNAAVYSVVRYGLQNGLEVYGIQSGYQGLIDGKVSKLNAAEVDDIIYRGGTVLSTARCPDMKTEDGQKKAVKTLKQNGIEGLIVIGGDGSFNGAKVLSTQYGIKTMGIPGTIDNDLAYTDFTLGFDSATTVVINSVQMLRDTMACNGRTCVVEVMGRNCGDIALYSGLASGAEVIIVPEVGYNLDEAVNRLVANEKVGKTDNIILVAEGACTAEQVSADIAERVPSISIRSVTLGHIQRGGNATLQDRLLGIRMGARAVELLMEGKTNRVIGIRNNEIIDEDIVEALSKTKRFNVDLYNLANKLSEYK
ncbi:MAG: 6-phosphofructokinase [Corallococcus sp.]|nr:6-phosphofructokinase [Bacillota bacterium]MCM1534048.1 6-phosphofructokinase [Corallococcus sp.]